MKVIKVLQFNNYDNCNTLKPQVEQNQDRIAKNSYSLQSSSLSFEGQNPIMRFINRILGEKDREAPKFREPERPAEYEYERRPVQQRLTKKVVKEGARRRNTKPPVIKNTEGVKVKIQKPVVHNKYELIDEYDRLTNARAELRNKTQGRALTPEEKSQSEDLRLEWSKVYKQLVPMHQSIIRTKTAADFANETEKRNYIMNYVLPRMSTSEESALDALDMFEQFGFRADYPNSFNTTITKLSEELCALPKECKSDKVLNRFIEVFDKFADSKPSKHPDDEELVEVITYFTKKGSQEISEDTILRGIDVLKRIVCQSWCHDCLDDALVSSYEAKYKDSQNIRNALDDFYETAKVFKYKLEASDR